MTDLIPAAALESHIGILGKTGSGKSNLAKVLAERLMHAGERVCAIDPTGTFWGLRLDAAGKKPSLFKPVIFGGDHGDIPISEQHGTVLGEAIGTSADSAIIDTQQMRVGERTRFAADFAEALLRANRGPLHLIIDEAHLFAPQGKVNDPQSGKMLGAFNNLISLGRGRGLRIILISQRPAKLAKDSLTQVETLIAMRLIAPQDRNAVKDWVGEWADADLGKEITASLPSLPRGDAWVWSPQINYLERKHFPLAATFDSGTAEANSAGRELPPIDLATIGTKMDTIRQEAQANDPKRLKARIAELEREKAKPVSISEVDEDAIFQRGKVDGYSDGHIDGYAEGIRDTRQIMGQQVLDFAATFALATASELPKSPTQVKAAPISTTPPKVHTPAKPVQNVANGASRPKIVAQDAAMGAERKPLAILARIYPGGYTDAQWAALAGFKRTGGTWGTYKSRLRSAGRIEERGDLWYATAQGAADIGETDPMPEAGLELVEFWCGKIGAENKFLRRLAEVYPEGLTKTELAEHFDMTASGGTFGTYLSRLRSNGLIEEGGRGLRASPNLMGFDA